MTLLPFQVGDIVVWHGVLVAVIEVKGDRVVVQGDDGMVRITTDVVLQQHQVRRERA